MKVVKAFALTCFLAMWPAPVHAALWGWPDPSVRAQTMGGAYTGLADGTEALYWNPAGLAFLRTYEAVATSGPAFFDFPEISLAGGIPVADSVGIAISSSVVMIRSIPNQTGGTLPPWMAIESSIGGGIRRGPVGIGIALDRFTVWDTSNWQRALESEGAIDLGGFGLTNILGGSSVGFSVLGLAPRTLPDLRAGAAARALASGRLTLALDVRAHPRWRLAYGTDRSGLSQYLPAAHFGAEYRFAFWRLACAARLGAQADVLRIDRRFNFRRDVRLSVPSIGFSAGLPLDSYCVTLTYAFVPSDLFLSAWLSLTVAGNAKPKGVASSNR